MKIHFYVSLKQFHKKRVKIATKLEADYTMSSEVFANNTHKPIMCSLASQSGQGPILLTLFDHNSNLMENSCRCHYITGHRIAISTAVLAGAKFCSNHFIRIGIKAKWNSLKIWIVMEKFWVRKPQLHILHSQTTLELTSPRRDMNRPHCLLTHWGRDKMAAIFQTTLSNAFSWIRILEFWLRFHWSLFLRVQLTIFHHWFR